MLLVFGTLKQVPKNPKPYIYNPSHEICLSSHIVQHNVEQPNNIQKQEEYITIAPKYRIDKKTINDNNKTNNKNKNKNNKNKNKTKQH